MNPILIFSYAFISVFVLYLLNKVFKYKDKLVRILGPAKYKGILLVSTLTILSIIILKNDIQFNQSPLVASIMFSYIYLST